MDSEVNLIEKDWNKETKKYYKTKKFWIIISIITLCIITALILIIIFTTTKININFNYKIITSEYGNQNILVNWTSERPVDISINVKGVENEIIRTYNISNTIAGEKLAKVYFGLPKLYIKVKKWFKILEIEEQFKIIAKEVLLAPLQATLAPLMFSLDIFNIKKNFDCLIYVALSRYKAWNWNNLPERVFLFDILDENNFHSLNFYSILDKLKLWMAQMYQINNDIMFNLFINDYHNYIIPICIYANNIPSKNYKIYMLTDGTASYSFFNEMFDNKDTYIQNYERLKKRYLEFRDFIRNRGDYDKYSKEGKNIDIDELKSYVYTMVKEENNTFWWLTKIKGVFAPHNPEIVQELLNNPNITVKDINTLFKSLDNKQKEFIKNLFNLNSNYFEEAYKQNKLVMLILGTNGSVERNLYDYCLTTQLFYKDDYIYYYKAHPATPIEDDKQKIDDLIKINVIPIDSNIPFEVIYYFNHNISCSGYNSSSFIEVRKENLASLFEQYKKEGEYNNKFDYFCQYIKKDDKKYGQYLNDNDDGTVLEINTNKLIDFDYDFGIYLKNIKSIVYYKYNESKF